MKGGEQNGEISSLHLTVACLTYLFHPFTNINGERIMRLLPPGENRRGGENNEVKEYLIDTRLVGRFALFRPIRLCRLRP